MSPEDVLLVAALAALAPGRAAELASALGGPSAELVRAAVAQLAGEGRTRRLAALALALEPFAGAARRLGAGATRLRERFAREQAFAECAAAAARTSGSSADPSPHGCAPQAPGIRREPNWHGSRTSERA